jgi:hypothetical protein
MTGKWLCLPVALCVLSAGCGGKKPEAAEKTAAAVKPATPEDRPTAVVEAQKGVYIAKFRLGSSFGPDGAVFAESHAFVPGDVVGASFEIPNAPAGSRVKVAWVVLPDKRVVAHQEAALVPDKPAVTFKGDSKGWALGEYEFVISYAEPGKDDARTMGNAPFKLTRDKAK